MLTMLAKQAHKAKFLLNNNSTTILTGMGVTGTVATAYLTGRASYRAAQIIEQEVRIINHSVEPEQDPVELTKPKKVQLVWRLYLPAFGVGVTTVTSIIVANRISSKKIAALAIASGISERALQEYKAKVIERLGDRQDQKIRDEVAQDRINGQPPNSQIIIAGSGDILCYDMLTGRYFQSTVEDIKRAENKINYELINFFSASFTQFCDEIGLPPTSYTDEVGWNMDSHVEVKFSTVMSPDNRPCIAIDFTRPPMPNYTKVYD